MTQPSEAHPLRAIRALDYTILYARDLPAMRRFYADVMRFDIQLELPGVDWIEFRVGSTLLVIAKPGLVVPDRPVPPGIPSVQLAFRVRKEQVDACEAALRADGVEIVKPAADLAWGHRALFFRDPDGNLLEIYADI